MNSEMFYLLVALLTIGTLIGVVVVAKALKVSFSYPFARYGGCTLPMLTQCHPHTVATRENSGTLLFGIVALSSVMAGFAWWQITKDPYVGWGVGIGWFSTFSLIDRAFMSTLDGAPAPFRVEGETRLAKVKRLAAAWTRNFVTYGLRIIIVSLTAYVNTSVVQSMMFRGEIERVIATRSTEFVTPAIKKRDEANDRYGKVISGWNNYLAKERNTLRQYENVGQTTQAAEIKRILQEKEEEFRKVRDSGVEKRALVAAEEELRAAEDRAAAPVGPADREAILKELAERNHIIKVVYGMIFVIELAAFLYKLGKRKDEYDYKVTRYEEWSRQVQYVPVSHGDIPQPGFQETIPPGVSALRRS